MTAIITALVLASSVPCPNPSRSRTQVSHFKKTHPCPGGKDKGSTARCTGYIVDHRCPRACGGYDRPSNMQWQTTAASKKKDAVELDCGRFCNSKNQSKTCS